MMVTSTRPVYRLADGSRVPPVTTILYVINKPALPVWANRLGFNRINSSEHLAYLAGAGTLAHSLIAQQLGGPVADYAGYFPDQVTMAERALSGFLAWGDGRVLETHELELSLTSEAHRYGGTLDALLLVDGMLTVIDWKTSSAIYPEHLYQLAGYHQLLVENGYTVDAAMVLRLDRDEGGEFAERVIPADGIEPYFNVFTAALNLYNLIKQANGRQR